MTVRLQEISHFFGSSQAIVDCSLDVQRGELLALVGPSGCGKTTLLNTIAGVVQPSTGLVLIDGRDVTRLAIRERRVGYIMEDFALYPHLSVRGNIEYPLRVRAVGKVERNQRTEEIAELLGIATYLDRRPHQLSQGERQRVAIGRALIRDDLMCLLADEPFANLDLLLARRLRHDFRVLQRRRELTCIFVTHSQSEAMVLGDRVAIMRAGKIEQIGASEALYYSPANTFVASFFGDPPMNLMQARLDGDEVRVGNHVIGFADRQSAKLMNGPCVLGIRAEDVVMTEPNNDTLVGQIELIEADLPDWTYTVKLGDQQVIVRSRSEKRKFNAKVGLKLCPGKAVLFENTTGDRISTKLRPVTP